MSAVELHSVFRVKLLIYSGCLLQSSGQRKCGTQAQQKLSLDMEGNDTLSHSKTEGLKGLYGDGNQVRQVKRRTGALSDMNVLDMVGWN